MRSWGKVISICLLAAAIGGAGFVLVQKHTTKEPPLPIAKAVLKSLGYEIYSPNGRKLPNSLKLDRESVEISGGVLFYQLKNEGQQVFVSQQSLPNPVPTLGAIADFGNLETPIGKGVIGMQQGRNAAIITTKTSLITITATKDTSTDTIGAVGRNLSLVSPN